MEVTQARSYTGEVRKRQQLQSVLRLREYVRGLRESRVLTGLAGGKGARPPGGGSTDGDASGEQRRNAQGENPRLFHLNECVNGSQGAGMRGLSTYAFSTVLAVNNPCARLCHLLGVHFVELCRKQ